MSITGLESLAGLQLLVAVAKADGDLTPGERGAIAGALAEAHLPPGVTSGELIHSSGNVDSLIEQISSPEARDTAFGACLTMAYAHGRCAPKQREILDRIDTAWGVAPETRMRLDRVLSEACETVWRTRIDTGSEKTRLEERVREEVLRHCVLTAVLGLHPIPLASVETDLAVVGLQVRMIGSIGGLRGRATSMNAARHMIADLGVGTGARVAIHGLTNRMAGAAGSLAASRNFASTWALGQVADLYGEGGGRTGLDDGALALLRATFEESKEEGRRLYETHRPEVEARHRDHLASIDGAAADCRAGRITVAEYATRIADLP